MVVRRPSQKSGFDDRHGSDSPWWVTPHLLMMGYIQSCLHWEACVMSNER